ncbi:MAG: FAD-dependent oxidoreductase [Propionibacteriaceae bacterium]|nr:FAD-dependent oxidoreductase [Propionibacteriaceae bacterium]
MLDCAIVGGGLAGLTAALDLVKRGLDVVVLEARDRVGGRIENGILDDGQYVELGGQWIGAGHDAVQELVERYGLMTVGLPNKGNLVMRLRGQAVEVPSAGDGPALSPFEVSDLGQGLLRLRRLAQRLRSDAAWSGANDKWLRQDLRRWIKTNLRTQGAQQRFIEVYSAAFGPMSREATLLEGLHQVNSGPDLESMLASNGGLNQRRVEGGMFEVCRAMAEDLGGRVRLGAVVDTIEHGERSATVVLSDGERITASNVISTLPPRLSTKMTYDPPLPSWRTETAAKVAAGNVIKAFLVYEKPFWRELGLSGQSSADEGSVRVTFDTTTGESERGLLMGYFEGADADSLSKRSVTLRQRSFVDSVVKTFGDVAAKPIDYIERDWSTEPFTAGCHGAHFAPGVWTTNGPVLAEPEGTLHWAGAEYSNRFNGYMEGAVRSGLEVAAAVARNCA